MNNKPFLQFFTGVGLAVGAIIASWVLFTGIAYAVAMLVQQGGTGTTTVPTSAWLVGYGETSTRGRLQATTTLVANTIHATSTVATSTFAGDVSFDDQIQVVGGSFTNLTVTGTCTGCGAGLSGGSLNALAMWSSATAVTSTSSQPLFVGSLNATTSTASIFTGGLVSQASSTFSSTLDVTGAATFPGGVTVTCTSCITDTNVSNTLTASDLVAGSSVVSNAEVDDDITLTNITQITNRAIANLTTSATAGNVFFSSGTVPTTDSVLTWSTASNLLGVATDTPTQALSVQGGVLISGNITSVSGITATGTLSFNSATAIMRQYPAFSYATTSWSGTTTIFLAPAFVAETWNAVKCETNTGTLMVSFTDGTNRTETLNASTTIGNFTLATNNTFTASESRRVDIGTPATSPLKVACTIDKTINQ